MKSWGNRDTIHRTVVNNILSASNDKGTAPELPDKLTFWLAQLSLLYGVPVEYLVPDNRLLPTESMRFFYVDRNWQDRLIDGALSVGVFSSREKIFNEAFFESIYEQVDIMQQQLRAMLRKETPPDVTETGGPISGLIFRSCVVSGWPGMEIEAFKEDKKLDILRMDRLSDNVLLCLFNGVPDKVDFIEPGEGLHFGIVRDTPTSDTFQVYLRGLGFPDNSTYPAGEQINVGGNYLKASGTLLTGPGQEPGVLDIDGLRASITAAMPQGALKDGVLTPSELAIQLVQGAGKQTYDLNSPECFFSPAQNEN